MEVRYFHKNPAKIIGSRARVVNSDNGCSICHSVWACNKYQQWLQKVLNLLISLVGIVVARYLSSGRNAW